MHCLHMIQQACCALVEQKMSVEVMVPNDLFGSEVNK